MPSRGRPRQSRAQVGRSHAMEQIAPLPARDDETGFLKKLNCFSGKRLLPVSHCTSEQPPVATGSPEAHAGFPTALTATAVSHGNRGKAAEASWVLASFPGLHLLLSGPGWSQFPGGLRWPLWSRQSPSSAGPSPRLPERRVRPGLDFWQSPRQGEKPNSLLPADTQHPRHRAGCSPACSQVPNLPRLNGEEIPSKHERVFVLDRLQRSNACSLC